MLFGSIKGLETTTKLTHSDLWYSGSDSVSIGPGVDFWYSGSDSVFIGPGLDFWYIPNVHTNMHSRAQTVNAFWEPL